MVLLKLHPIRISLTPGFYPISGSLFRHQVNWPKQVTQLSPKLRGMKNALPLMRRWQAHGCREGHKIGANHSTSHRQRDSGFQMQMTSFLPGYQFSPGSPSPGTETLSTLVPTQLLKHTSAPVPHRLCGFTLSPHFPPFSLLLSSSSIRKGRDDLMSAPSAFLTRNHLCQ